VVPSLLSTDSAQEQRWYNPYLAQIQPRSRGGTIPSFQTGFETSLQRQCAQQLCPSSPCTGRGLGVVRAEFPTSPLEI